MRGSVLRLTKVLATAVTALALGATSASAAVDWNLTNDFKTSPNQTNPQADSLGHAGVWEFMYSAGGSPSSDAVSREPDFFSRLESFETGSCAVPGWENWVDAASAKGNIGKNTGATSSACGSIVWPTGTINVGPGIGHAAVIAWHSPVTGHVSIAGRIDDNDSGGGNGVDWTIERGGTQIASGAIANGDTTGQQFSAGTGGGSLSDVTVSRGDAIYLLIGPNGGFDFDNSGLEYTISANDADSDDVTDECDADASHADGDGDGLADACDSCPSTAGTAAENGCVPTQGWDLAGDFDASKNDGTTTWQYMQSGTAASRDPSTFSLLSTAASDSCNVAWVGTGGPFIGKNPSTQLKSCGTGTFPAGQVSMDQSTSNGHRYAVAAWKSPITGTVAISGAVSDNDPNGGDGTNWFIDRQPGAGEATPVNLAHGHLSNGTRLLQRFADGTGGSSLSSVSVKKDQFLYLLIGDPADVNSESYDNTMVKLHIKQLTAAAQVTIAPTSWSFGDVGVGTTATHDFTITNHGGGDLHVNGFTLTGSGFSVDPSSTVSTCLGTADVPPGGSCTARVRFAPTTAGPRSGSITVDDDDTAHVTSAALQGTGTATAGPDVSISPTLLQFANTAPGASRKSSVTVTNTGDSTLHITNIEVFDVNGGTSFQASTTGNGDDCSKGGTLLAGATCKVAVVFAPPTSSTYSGKVRLTDDATSGTQQTANIAGTGSGEAPADTQKPTIAIAAPEPDGRYVSSNTITADYACSDAGGSGIESCTGSVANGAPIDLAYGGHTFTVVAKDHAGNTATKSVSYRARQPLASPTNSGTFTVAGITKVGEQVGVRTTAPWEPAESLYRAYKWERCDDKPSPTGCVAIAGADSDLYRISTADRGHRLRVRITAWNPDSGFVDKITPLSARVFVPVIQPSLEPGKAPDILGTLAVGETVSATPGTWSGTSPITYRYQWQRCSVTTPPVCVDIPGAYAQQYKIGPQDKGHPLQVYVYATNDAATNWAWSGFTRNVQADRASQRTALINDAYLAVFGRKPKPGELKHYADWDKTSTALVAELRDYVTGDRPSSEEIVDRAYAHVYGHKHSDTQEKQFDDDVAAEMKTARPYSDLIGLYAKALTKQAYEKVFFWAPKVSNPGLVSDAVRKKSTDRFVANVKNDRYRTAGDYTAGEKLWTAVATSNEPLHGAARTDYDGFGTDGASIREECFGGVGPACTGAVPWKAPPGEIVGRFTTLDGRKMAYLKLTTVVGSILHDSMCRTYPDTSKLPYLQRGQWCGGLGTALISEVPLTKFLYPGTSEWNKAVSNTLQGKSWKELYGPYPLADAQNAIKDKTGATYSDDLRPAPSQSRHTEVQNGGIVFGAIDFSSPHAWDGVEVRASLRLEAPAGVTLDPSDQDFCRAGAFVAFTNRCE